MPPHSSSSGHHPLRISPRELVFKVPVDRVSTALLKLHNVGQSPIVYKVKTTAPQRYCVRPNNGVLPPGETIDVQVLLNYVKDAQLNVETKDKFQIQSIVLSGSLSNATDIGEVWAKATPEQITKQKLRSKFVSAPQEVSKPPALATTISQEHLSHDTPPSTSTFTVTTDPPISTTTTTHDEFTSYSQTTQPTIQLSQSLPASLPSQPSPTVPGSPLQLSYSLQSLPSDTVVQQPPTPPTSSPQFPPQFQPQFQSQFQSPPMADKKSTLLAESSDSVNPSETKSTRDSTSHLPTLDFRPQETLPKESHPAPYDTHPKQTGDYVVDTVANFAQLRKALEQVAALKTERETSVKDNQRLNDQVKALAEQLQRARDEHQVQTGLRQRPIQNTTLSPTLVTSRPDQSQQQMLIQIQTRVLLFVILFFSVIGFLLGRFTR